MRGDQVARQLRVIRTIESSPNGLTAAEIAKREEMGIRTICRYLVAPQAAGFPLYTERTEKANHWVFVDTFKFEIPPPFTWSLAWRRRRVGADRPDTSLPRKRNRQIIVR